MDTLQAKNSVIEAGKKLVGAGLIIGPWGGISCRIDDRLFAVTPMGHPLDELTPDDIIVAEINKRSFFRNFALSEVSLHGDCYRLRPEINFIIRTNQLNASALSVLSRDILVQGIDNIEKIGRTVRCAQYALPGTSFLSRNVAGAAVSLPSRAVLIANSGAVCMGENFNTAYFVALTLEELCEDRFRSTPNTLGAPYDKDVYNSIRRSNTFVLLGKDGESFTIPMEGAADSPLPREAEIHRAIYQAYSNVRCISHSVMPYTLAVSRNGYGIKPLLNDFAGCVGIGMACTSPEPEEIVRKLRHSPAVLVKNRGAFCCSDSQSSTALLEMIVEKDCKAQTEASLISTPQHIRLWESALIRAYCLRRKRKGK
ncbi:MAG: class II aldolase/adducin family protein [Clostridiales bacterium]|nr:class II aldolase/adducin family protein [Clostridiales bacterium]